MLQRIRQACKQGSFKLSNIVEVDETYIGGKEKNKHANKKLNAGRGVVDKTAVFGMKERGVHNGISFYCKLLSTVFMPVSMFFRFLFADIFNTTTMRANRLFIPPDFFQPLNSLMFG
jgi:hypothetical protein